jgi:uncharacterized protein (DUF433 family)
MPNIERLATPEGIYTPDPFAPEEQTLGPYPLSETDVSYGLDPEPAQRLFVPYHYVQRLLRPEADQASRVLNLLGIRLHKAARGASREAEVREYAVPLHEAFKVASDEYPSVTTSPDVMAGAPCITGTRIPIYMILDAIESTGRVEAARESYPRVTIQQIKDAIGFARSVVECPIEQYEDPSAPR